MIGVAVRQSADIARKGLMGRFISFLPLLALPHLAAAQDMPMQHDMSQHAAHMAGMMPAGDAMMPEGVTEPGQAAFAAIQEIVARLMADPATDWSRVDISALRQHLVDMDNVTLHAEVTTLPVDNGARFDVTSADPGVTASIRAMVTAHAAAMDGANGWTMQASEIPGGAELTVTGADEDRIRGLGFFGLLAVGMHHQAHHWAIATGRNPHNP